jgi:hypothetical protein
MSKSFVICFLLLNFSSLFQFQRNIETFDNIETLDNFETFGIIETLDNIDFFDIREGRVDIREGGVDIGEGGGSLFQFQRTFERIESFFDIRQGVGRGGQIILK